MHAPSSPLVSIVTPAYNEENFLPECIESVLAQTYSNWDYTIVDNSSNDGMKAVAQKYADRDPRIRVITNATTIPAIQNFNLALRQISPASKYCKMVLADDSIFPECLDQMVAVMEEHPTVGIVGAYGQKEKWVLWAGLPHLTKFFSGRQIGHDRLLGGLYIFGSPSSVLFRADLVRKHDPFFNESNPHADSEVCLKLLKECDFGFVHQVLTFSRDDRPNSMLNTSRALNTAAASFLRELVVYGPDFLSAEEYKDSLKRMVTGYYEFLGTSLLQRRGRKFWEFHKKELKESGIEFKYSQLVRALVRVYRREIRHIRKRNYWGVHPSD
jgi:glycosyltransferase involved in cell wall biosynthesis